MRTSLYLSAVLIVLALGGADLSDRTANIHAIFFIAFIAMDISEWLKNMFC